MSRVDVRLRNIPKLIFYSDMQENNQYTVKDCFQRKILQHLNNSKTLDSISMFINRLEII